MSKEARDWAFSQDVKRSSVKFVLVVLGDLAQSDEAYAAIDTVSEKTGQDRKTVIAALKTLEGLGLIADTGKRIGRTGQIPVYKLNLNCQKSTENGTVNEEDQAAETVPFFPDNSTVFPPKSTVFPSNSTENGTRNSKEPVLTESEPKELTAQKPEKKKRKSVKTQMPDGFAISERVRAWAAEKGFSRLEGHFENFISKAKAKGYEYADWDEGFMGAIRDDWAKLNQPRGSPPAKQSRHNGFEEKDYREGVTEDGRIA